MKYIFVLIISIVLITNRAFCQNIYLDQDTSFIYLKCENKICFTEVNFDVDSVVLLEGKANIKKVNKSCLLIEPFSEIIKLSIQDSIYLFKILLPVLSNNYTVFVDDKIVKSSSFFSKIDRKCKTCVFHIEDKPNTLIEYLFGKQKSSVVMSFDFMLIRSNKVVIYDMKGHTQYHDMSNIIQNSEEGDKLYLYIQSVRIFCGENAYYDKSTY